ncbi:MAG TPA: MATE family efflux transporter [Candidatus Gallacutalibacter pullistercoris]|nr:MATE family efflux transporter [Candidatus Gallacutalibacter pullistercoris]
MNLEKRSDLKMGTAPMLPLIISMALPAMFSMLVQALYNVVDSYFVAQISEDALTAVSLAYPIQMLLIAFGMGTAVGINSLISRRLGEGNQEAADSAASHGVLLGILNWVIFALFGLFFTRSFFEAYTSAENIISMGSDYLSIVCIYSFGLFIEANFEKTLQATGNMIWPMIFQLTGAVTNIILDPIFIFTLDMGVAGAAIATVIGQIAALVFSSIILLTREHAVKIHFRSFRFDWQTVKQIYIVGIPAIIMQAIGSVMTLAMNAILVAFSKTAVAVFGIYFKLQSFVFMPVFGLTQGLMPIMGYNYGARNRKRMLSCLKIGCVIGLLIMAAGTVLFWAIPDQLLMIFEASDEMLRIGRPALQYISLCFMPAALGILSSTLFQAMGRGFYSLIVSILRQLVVLIPAAWLLSLISLTAVWFAFPIAEVFSLITSVLLFLNLYRKIIRNLSATPVEA